MSLPGKLTPKANGSPSGPGYFGSIILKFPGNTAQSIETGDVQLLLSATDFIAKQWNGATYDDVTLTSLPNN